MWCAEIEDPNGRELDCFETHVLFHNCSAGFNQRVLNNEPSAVVEGNSVVVTLAGRKEYLIVGRVSPGSILNARDLKHSHVSRLVPL
jgi:hypothetical protein